MEYYSAIKKNEMPPAATWTDLGIVTVSEVRQRRKIGRRSLYVESKNNFYR